jgi:hypothetical protein
MKICKFSTAEYQATLAVNYSTLKAMGRSPAHYRAALHRGHAESPAMRKGTAVHCAILEPYRFSVEYVTYPGKVRRGREWEAFEASNSSKEILTHVELAEIQEIANAVRLHLVAAQYLESGEA